MRLLYPSETSDAAARRASAAFSDAVLCLVAATGIRTVFVASSLAKCALALWCNHRTKRLVSCQLGESLPACFVFLTDLISQNWLPATCDDLFSVAILRSSHSHLICRSHDFAACWLLCAILACCHQLRSQRQPTSDYFRQQFRDLRRDCSDWQHASHKRKTRRAVARYATHMHHSERICTTAERACVATARRDQRARRNSELCAVSARSVCCNSMVTE